eukprot:gene6814-8453_t
MDKVKQLIEKKRKEAQLNKNTNSNTKSTTEENNNNNNENNNDQVTPQQPPTKKYKTKGEIERELRLKKEEEKKKLNKDNDESNNKNIDTKDNTTTTSNGEQQPEPFLPKHIVIQRLRERGHPITYFGETDYERAERLRHLEENDPIEYTQGDNEFANILKKLEQQQKDKQQQQQQQKKDSNKDVEEESEEQLLAESKKSKEKNIYYFLYMLLKDWELQLEERSEEEKQSRTGKLAHATFYQCKEHIQPLFTHLKEKTLDKDILDHIQMIVECCKKREYVQANDEYLQMAIGNAPWPMGVTMVGIHERSSREKIFSNQVARM